MSWIFPKLFCTVSSRFRPLGFKYDHWSSISKRRFCFRTSRWSSGSIDESAHGFCELAREDSSPKSSFYQFLRVGSWILRAGSWRQPSEINFLSFLRVGSWHLRAGSWRQHPEISSLRVGSWILRVDSWRQNSETLFVPSFRAMQESARGYCESAHGVMTSNHLFACSNKFFTWSKIYFRANASLLHWISSLTNWRFECAKKAINLNKIPEIFVIWNS